MMMMKADMNHEEEEEEEQQQQQWSELAADLLTKMAEELYSGDVIRCRAVCKSWRRAICTKNRTMDKLPWLVTREWKDYLPPSSSSSGLRVCTSKLFDPIHRNPYAVSELINTNITRHEEFMLITSDHRAKICASNHGWLLFSLEREKKLRLITLLLFSPFTKQTIPLPDLPYHLYDYQPISHATFSSDPSNDGGDCAFFVLHDCHSWATVIISTCYLRDKKWTTLTYDRQLIHEIQAVVSFGPGGHFCCVSRVGTLVVFTIVDHTYWIIPVVDLPLDFLPKGGRFHVLECQQFLLLVCCPNSEELEPADECHVFWFDSSSMRWLRITRLLNHAIFIGHSSSFSFSVSAKLANKIYYHDYHGNLKFYCLEDGKSYRYEEEDECCIYKGWLGKVGDGDRVWIQPPRIN